MAAFPISSQVVGRSGARRRQGLAEARLRMLIGLCHRRWSLPILAELHKAVRPGGGGGAKFITLAKRLGLSRESLRDTLDELIAVDYLMRNPGVGHPLRPEYMLTEDGHDVAPHAAALIATLQRKGLEDVALRKWSLPTLLAIGSGATGATRFMQLRQMLPEITARALTLALRDLEAAKLITRCEVSSHAPVAGYRLTRQAKRIVGLLEQLAR